MPSLPEILWYGGKAQAAFWGITAGTIGWGLAEAAYTRQVPFALRFGGQMASFGVRSTYHVSVASARAFLGTTLVRGGSVTAGRALATGGGAVAAGYIAGAIVGTSIAHAMYGKEGAKDALKLYTGRVSRDEYFSTVGSAIKQTFNIR